MFSTKLEIIENFLYVFVKNPRFIWRPVPDEEAAKI